MGDKDKMENKPKHFDEFMAVAQQKERVGKPIEAGLFRVAAYNDYENLKQVPKPPLGKPRLLHQAYEETGQCLYCMKPMDDWEPFERCYVREAQSKSEGL